MSGYWEAVNRAALGLPGTAEPRPRSRFESDEDFSEILEIDAVDREMVTSPSPAAQPDAAVAQPIADAPTTDDRPAQRNSAAEPPAPPTASSQPAAQQRDRETLAPEPAVLREAVTEASENRSAEAPVATVELRRIETTRTIVKSIETPALPAIQSTPPRSITAEPIASPTIAAEPLAAAEEPGVSEIVMATPPALPPEPAPFVPVETAPLIIDIGRIDIRIASDAAPMPVSYRRREAGPVPSLDAYLARRSEAAI